MTKQDHQLTEMVEAIQQVTEVAQHIGEIEAKREVIAILDEAITNGLDDDLIIRQIMHWAGK
jgi:hypothetical protein